MTLFLASAFAWVSCTGSEEPADPNETSTFTSTPQHCRFEHAGAGSQRFAVVVGVETYLSPHVRQLDGPRQDAKQMRDTLVSRFGFDQRVCVLLDGEATTAAFRTALGNLADVVDEDDHVAIYFAGHGSHIEDASGDETDGRDETLMLADARHEGACDLSDDEFNAMLFRISAKTNHLTVILDSCSSGSATRGDATPRYEPPAGDAPSCQSPIEVKPDATGGLLGGRTLEGTVVLAAASDGAVAFEDGGQGLFTAALVKALKRTRKANVTWRQIRRDVVAQIDRQRPWFHGNIDVPVFGEGRVQRAFGWNIDQILEKEGNVRLSGLPLPGFSADARLRVYARTATTEDMDDPSKAKAELKVVRRESGTTALATILTERSPLTVDSDLAVLAVPGRDAVRLPLRLRAQGPGALSPERRREVLSSLEADNALIPLLNFALDTQAFEITASADGHLQLRGPEGRVRITFDADDLKSQLASLHARLEDFAVQRGLLQLQGEGGGSLTSNHSLEVQLVPVAPSTERKDCAAFEWTQEPPNQTQVVPICHQWAVKVRLADDADVDSMLVGGAILYNDGAIWGFPSDGRQQAIKPGQEVVFTDDAQQATLPYGSVEWVLVAATNEKEHLDWASLTRNTRGAPSAAAPVGPLGHALEHYLNKTRGGRRAPDASPNTWTTTVLPFRTELVPDFRAIATQTAPSTREYTIPTFDLRPYRPANRETALARVLDQVQYLTYEASPTGVSYCQHRWEGKSDLENLTQPQPRLHGEGTCTGIDCSRSVWFVFTRANVGYPGFLTTWGLEAGSEPMAEYFNDCTLTPPRLGDLLVYVGKNRDGEERRHVVMVIDPDKFVAWGSHGWDGSTATGNPLRQETPARLTPLASGPAPLNRVGVAFQMTKEGRDWSAWDWKDVKKVACWRHKEFATEFDRGLWETEEPGTPCDPNTCKTARR